MADPSPSQTNSTEAKKRPTETDTPIKERRKSTKMPRNTTHLLLQKGGLKYCHIQNQHRRLQRSVTMEEKIAEKPNSRCVSSARQSVARWNTATDKQEQTELSPTVRTRADYGQEQQHEGSAGQGIIHIMQWKKGGSRTIPLAVCCSWIRLGRTQKHTCSHPAGVLQHKARTVKCSWTGMTATKNNGEQQEKLTAAHQLPEDTPGNLVH